MKKSLVSWSLENGSIGYLVGYLEGEKSMDFVCPLKLCPFKISSSTFGQRFVVGVLLLMVIEI